MTKIRKKWLSLLLVTVMMTSSVPLYGQEPISVESQQSATVELVDDSSNTLDEQNKSIIETVDEDTVPQESSDSAFSALEFEAVSALEASGTPRILDINFGFNPDFQEVTVPADTLWNLQFDQDADVGTLTDDYIYVLDQEGNQVEISVVRKDYQSIYIAPEQGSYLPGQSYRLVLTKGIKNQKGESLSQTINVPFTSEYGRWEAGDSAFLMGTFADDVQKMNAGEASGLFFYSVMRDLSLEQEETYEIGIRADIEKDSTIGLDREVDSNPVIMTLTLYEDRNHPICQDLEVRASDFEEGFTDLKYLFTLPEDDAGNTLILQLKYWNLEDKNNICNLSVDNVHIGKVPLYQLDANYLQGSHTINSVIMSEDNGYSPQVQSNPSLSLEQLDSGNFRVTYISHDLVETDTDGDGLCDEMERNGFVYSIVKGFELWNGEEGDKYYKTDPTQWSTDGDPYGDQDEVTGLHIDSSIEEPGNDPLVASFPIMSIDVSGYTIVPQGEISLSNSKSVSAEFSESSSTTDTVSDSSTKGGEVSVSHEFGLTGGTSVSASAHYEKTHSTEHSVTKETGSTNGTAQEWAQAITSNPGEAAHLKLNVKLKNSGTATARDIIPTFNISIGDRLLTTVTPSSVNVLRPDMETEEFIIDSDSDGDPIILTLSELKSLQLGAPLKIKLLDEQTDAKVSRWDEETNNWDTVASWIDSKTQIESRTATLRLGQDQEVQEYKVFAGSDYYSPQITLGQALLHISNYQKREDGIYINGQKMTSQWVAGIANMPEDYMTKNPPKDNDLMNLVLTPGMQISLDSRNFEPRIIWAKNYHTIQDYQQKVEAWIVSGMYPIERVYVKGIQSGQSATVLMSKSADSLYYEANLPDDFVALEVGATDRNEETIVFKLDGSEEQQLNDGAECFFQGAGYEQGGYYAKGQPTTFNWTRQSQFIGPQDEPALRWKKQSEYTIVSSPVVVGDDKIYVMSVGATSVYGDNRRHVLKSSDGTDLWGYSKSYGYPQGQPFVDALGRFYEPFDSGGPAIYDQEWTYLGGGPKLKLNGYFNRTSDRGAGFAVGKDMTLYGIFDKKLFAFDRSTDGDAEMILTTKWEYALDATDDFTNSSPAIGKDGTIFVAGGNHVYALTPSDQTCEEKWKKEFDLNTAANATFAYTVPVIGDDGTIYILDTLGDLRALSPDDGSVSWMHDENHWLQDIKKDWTVQAPAIGADGNIYYGTAIKYGGGDDISDFLGGQLHSINPDGSKNWTKNLPYDYADGGILSAPLIGADGTIYVGDYNGILYALDPEAEDEDKIKWQVDTGDGEITTSPAMDQYGNIYVAAGNTVYAYGQKNAGEFQFANPYHTIEEQDGTVTLEIARTGGLEGEVTLYPYIYGISADSGTDYVDLSDQQITFQDSELFKKIEINLKDDDVYEGTECLYVTLSLDSGIPTEEASIGSHGTAIITIMDNDESPSDIEMFKQGEGYLPGAYDLEAQQPTSVNYNGWSRFAGPEQKPEKNWDFTAEGMLVSSAAVASDMTVYVGSANIDNLEGKLYAVNPDGTQKWVFPSEPDTAVGLFMAAPVIGADGTIYAFCTDGKLYALDAKGNKKWEQQLQPGGEIQFSPAIASDGMLYVGGDKLYAINPEAGPNDRVKWDFVTEDGIESAPAIARDGTIYIGDGNGILYAVEPNGIEKWRIEIGSGESIMGQIAIGSDYTIYFGSDKGKVYAVNADGSQKWVYSTGSVQAISPIVGSDGTIYIGTQSPGKLIAIDASGSQKWETAVEGDFMSAPVIDSMGTLYIGSIEGDNAPGTGTLYAFNSDGQEKWSYEIGGGIYFSSPVIAKDGTLFVTACDNKLYSLGGQGQVMFDVTQSAVDEGAGTVNLTVKRIGPAQGEVRVDYTLENGSATYGEDFLGSADTIVFGDGEISKDIAIEIIDDRTYEIDDQTYEKTENFSVQLTNPMGGVVLGNNNRITVIIKDNDPIPAENLQFFQGQGYAWGGYYDVMATQPTVFNWTRQSQFMGGYTNDVKWDIPLGEVTKAITTSPVIGSDGSIYISADDELFKVDADGVATSLHVFDQTITAPMIGYEGIIYVGCQDGNLYAVNSDTGAINNTCAMNENEPEPVLDPPVFGGESFPLIYVTTELGNLYIIVADGSDLHKLDDYVFMTDVSSGLAIGRNPSGYQSVIAGQDNTIVSAGEYGDVLSTLGTMNGTIMETPAIGADGTIYAVSNDVDKGGFLGAFTRAGVEKWSIYLDSDVIIQITSSPAIAKDGTIYFGADDGNLYAIDPSDGSQKWTFNTGGVVESTPLIGNDGTIFVGSNSNKFYAINSDGMLKWEYDAGSSILSSPAMGRDGSLYFGTEDGRLLAVGGKLGEVGFEYSTYEVNENEGSIDITLIQEGSTQMPLTLACSTQDGTAIAGEDYVAISENVVFAPGETEKKVTLTCMDDDVFEGRKNLKLILSNPEFPELGLGDLIQATVYIMDDDEILFEQGQGYEQGDYDVTAPQAGAFNWNRRSSVAAMAQQDAKWAFATGDIIQSSAAVGADGTLYFGSLNHKVYAVNSDGSQKWAYLTQGPVISSPTMGADGILYVGSNDHYLYALNPDGSLQWKYEAGGALQSSPAIDFDGNIIIGSMDQYLYSIDKNGTPNWKMSTEGEILSSPAVGNDGRIYVGSRDQKLYAFDPNGVLLWTVETKGDIESSPVIANDGTIYVGSFDDTLYAIDPNGSIKWTFASDDWFKSTPAIGTDGTIYGGSFDHYLYAIAPDGHEKWKFDAQGRIQSSALIDGEGTIYIATHEGMLYGINSDGTMAAQIELNEEIQSSPAMSSNGTLYVGTSEGNLYAIGEISAEERPIWPENAGVTTEELQSTQVTLNWTAAQQDVAEYGIYQDGLLITTVSGDAQTWLVTDLVPETEYTFQIQYQNAVGIWSTDGPSVTCTTLQQVPDYTSPIWPSDKSLSVTHAGEDTLILQWTTATDDIGATQYQVYQDDQLIDVVQGSINEYVVDNLRPGTAYEYRVEAGDAAGNWSSDGPSVTGETLVSDKVQLTIEKVLVGPGQEVMLPITLKNGTGISGFQFAIGYDPNQITSITAEKGTLISNSSDWTVTDNPKEGKLMILGYNGLSQGLSIGDGELINLRITVNSTMGQETIIPIVFDDSYDLLAMGLDEQSVSVLALDGEIKVFAFPKGDANNDRVVNVLDVGYAVNMALEKIQPTESEKTAADVNQDGNVNVLDVTKIADIALRWTE